MTAQYCKCSQACKRLFKVTQAQYNMSKKKGILSIKRTDTSHLETYIQS